MAVIVDLFLVVITYQLINWLIDKPIASQSDDITISPAGPQWFWFSNPIWVAVHDKSFQWPKINSAWTFPSSNHTAAIIFFFFFSVQWVSNPVMIRVMCDDFSTYLVWIWMIIAKTTGGYCGKIIILNFVLSMRWLSRLCRQSTTASMNSLSLGTVDNHGNLEITETMIFGKCCECRDFAKMLCFCQNAVVLRFRKNILFLISIIWS